MPVIEGLAAADATAQISIDTSKAAVARGGARRRRDARQRRDRVPRRPGDGRAGRRARASSCCLMHMLGEPRTMQDDPRYDDVVADVKAFLEERMAFAVARRDRRGADPARPGHRLRQDARAQPRAAAPPRRARRARAPGRDRHLAQVVPRAGSPGARSTSGVAGTIATNVLALRARGARVPRPRRRARRRRARGGGCYGQRRDGRRRRRRVRRRRRGRRRGGAPSPRSRSRSAASRCSPTSA